MLLTMLILMYGNEKKYFFHGLDVYEKKEFFHCHINTQTIFKFPDKLIGKGCPTTGVLSTRYVERKTADSIAAPRRNVEADSAAP